MNDGLSIGNVMTNPTSRPFIAALWMMGAIASFTLMAVAGREVQTEMNSFELMAWRSAIGFVVVLALLSVKGFGQIKTQVPWLHVKRNVLHFAGQNLWFYGVTVISFSQLVALEFTNPIWVILLAPFFLGERFTVLKAGVAFLGFIGVVIVATQGGPSAGPESSGIEIGHFAALGAALGFAFNTIYTRKLMAHDSVLCVLFWMTISQCIMGVVIGAPGGIPLPSSQILPWLIAVGITGLSAHYCLTSALGQAPATLVAPMEFFRLPILSLVGAYFYGEPFLFSVLIGGVIIFAANLLNIFGARRQ